MREVSFSVGRNNRKVQGFLHEDLSPYCETVKRRPAMIVCPGGAYMHLSPREAEPVAFRYFARALRVLINLILTEDSVSPNAFPMSRKAML